MSTRPILPGFPEAPMTANDPGWNIGSNSAKIVFSVISSLKAINFLRHDAVRPHRIHEREPLRFTLRRMDILRSKKNVFISIGKHLLVLVIAVAESESVRELVARDIAQASVGIGPVESLCMEEDGYSAEHAAVLDGGTECRRPQLLA